MSVKTKYGQFCPLSMSAEFLCTRWTMLVLRELLLGSESFSDIARGVPRMSRTLLSNRLKELTQRGIVSREIEHKTGYARYILTPAGDALGAVVFNMADWGQEWLQIEPSLEDVDGDHLMWSIRRSAKPQPELPTPFIVHFFLCDQPKGHQNNWLVFKDGEVDLCIIDHNFEVDVQLEATASNLTRVWMGWSDLNEKIKSGDIILRGKKEYTKLVVSWLGQSRLASIQKQPEELRVS